MKLETTKFKLSRHLRQVLILIISLFLNIIPNIILAQEGAESESQQESSFNFVYNQRYSEFEAELNTIGFDSLYNSNKWFRKFVLWNKTTREQLWPHNNFITKYEIDQQYFKDIDTYPLADGDCEWRELGPLNHHDWNWGHQALTGSYSRARGIGPMNFISFDPHFATTNLVFTGGWRSGLFYSDDAGESWHSAGTDNFPPPVSASDCISSQFDSNTWFLTTGGNDGYFTSSQSRSTGLYRTFNRGETWELIGSPKDLGGQSDLGWNYSGWNLKRVLIDPNSTGDSLTMFVTGSRGIYRTLNPLGAVGENGETDEMDWDNIYQEDNSETLEYNGETYTLKNNWSYDIAYKQNEDGSYDSQNLFVTGTKRYKFELNDTTTLSIDKAYILHSTDNGTTWNELIPFENDNNLLDYQRYIVRTTPENPDLIYFNSVMVSSNSFKLFKYNLNNANWVSTSSKGYGVSAISAFDISPLNDSLIHTADGITKNYSEDAGTTWPHKSGNRVDIHLDVEEIQFQPDGSKVWYATHGGISIYDIATDTWAPKNVGLNGAEVLGFSISRSNPEKITIGLYHDGSMISGDGYSSETLPKWKQVLLGDGEENLIDFGNDEISYVSHQYLGNFPNNFRKNEDGWLTDGSTIYMPGNADWYTSFEANEFESQILYVARAKNIYRHLNRGEGGAASWQLISDFSQINSAANAYKIHTSIKNSDLLFTLIVFSDKIRSVYATNKAMSDDLSSIVDSWFSIPAPAPQYENHWTPDIISDPDNVNVFYILHGGAKLNGNNTTHKITKYTYNGVNIMDDDVSTIESNGFTREDLTFNLPNIKVQQLFIIPGSRDWFIATNYDVWVSEQDKIDSGGDNVWERLGSNLPHVSVNRMEVGYKYNLIRIGLNGRGVWEHCLPCIIKDYDLVIDEDMTIDNFARYSQNVRITNNARVTITGEVQMVTGASITIEPGSFLFLDGGTITSACGDLWDGIYVEGTSDLYQSTTSTNHGHLKLLNGAIIENAYTAVRNWGLKPNGDTDWNKTGGILRAYNSTFLNNRWDVSFLTYQQFKLGTPKKDMSEFIDCDFIDNDSFVINSSPAWAFGMYKVHNISIIGCTFADNRLDLEENEKSNGIESVEAYFTIDNSPDSISEFNNLKYGVRSYDYSSKSIVIQNTDFNCFQSINLNGISDAKVNFNNFEVPVSGSNSGAYKYAYGLYLDMCHNYEVEENNFYSELDPLLKEGSFGVLVNNRHGESSRIYNNTFDNFYVATEAIGQNKDEVDETGLEFRCNNYSNNKYDVFVTPDYNNPGPVVGIAEFQGDEGTGPDKPAGNLFGNDSPVLESNYNNKGDFLFYIHHRKSSNQYVTPIKYSNIDLHEVGALYIPELSCPTQNTGGGGDNEDEIKIAALKSTAETSANEVIQIDNQLATLVDGGNTEQMENDVILTDDADAWMKYQALMESAGYLSDEVLDEVSKKEIGFNKAMVRNILVANPQAAKSKKVQESLDNRGDQLPDYMRDQIDMGLTKMSSKEYLELVKATHQTRHNAAIDQLVSMLKSDTINNRSSEIVDALSNSDIVAFDYKLVAYYDAQNQNNLADMLMEIINGYSLSDNQQQFFDNYSDFRNLTKQWQQSGVNMSELDSAKLQELNIYAELNNSIAAKAIALQQLNGDYSYIEPIYNPEDGDKSNTNTRRKRVVINDNKLLLFPNPADGYFTIEYSLTDPFNKAVLVVFDISGRVIVQQKVYYEIDQMIIPSENWLAGQYMVSLFSDGKTIMTKKITISK